ncbi:TonB-dependent receptor [Novosphingobium taihuense]|uniref:Iron complex outermembrane receptor protein n=1 Tax=Novosphingobium taihuense TaxID=260085 RepID=A0A7W7A8L7_9SPHN|nr:TonB-dependent receptor [Novosphingobium taihuense]MBB4612276.1 iron complex outermembrane receptor protein [Novosphingobium taihuense]TWH88370.1 iron complex outermembrane receptor protein [Novosphingobium taihuense]
MRTGLWAASAATVALCLLSGAAIAQENAAATATDEGSSAIEEIVVTAQHRSEKVQSVPLAISAVSGGQLASAGIASVQDLAGSVPGLVVSKSVSYGLAPIAIRGIGGPVGGGSLLTDQPVAVYADGVYVRALGQSTSDFLDVDKIEVLRGPQGTLYGRNSTAGAMLISSKRPDTARVEANGSIGYGSFEQVKLSGALNVPLVAEKVALRIAGSYTSGGDWARNTVDSRKFGGGTTRAVRASLRVTPSEDVTIDLIGEHATADARPAMLQLATISLSGFGAGGARLFAGMPHVRRTDYATVRDNRTVQVLGDVSTETRSDNVTLNLEWRASDDITVTSISGYRRFRVNGQQDTTPWVTGALPGEATLATWNGRTPLNSAGAADYRMFNPTGAPTFALGWNGTDQKFTNWSQELRIAGSGESFKWTAGVYYAKETVDGSVRIVNEQGGPPMITGTLPPVSGAAGLDLAFATSQDRDIYAVFADGTYSITPQISLTAGIRYTRDDKSVEVVNTTKTLRPSVDRTLNAGVALNCPTLVQIGIGTSCSRSDEEVTPRVVLDFKPSANRMVYASWSRGFTAGGFNNFATPASSPIVPLDVPVETIDNFEVGTKNEFFGRRLRLNMTAFLSEYSNLQIRQAVNTGGVAIVPVEKARIKGVEIELLAKPIPGLTLGVNGAFTDAKIRRGTLNAFPDALGTINMGSLQTPSAVSVAGNRLTRAPRWQGNVMAGYELPVSYGKVSASATLRFQSATFFQETNQALDQFKGEAWQELDLRVATGGDRWELSAFVNNVFDKRYATQIVPFFILPIATLNTPRSFGARLSFNY